MARLSNLNNGTIIECEVPGCSKGITARGMCAMHLYRHYRTNTIERIKPVYSKEFKAELQIWRGVKGRCYCKTNTNYPMYGGKGIVMCDKWRNSFERFLEDMGMRPGNSYDLDRVKSEGNYCKENCEWILQSINRSRARNEGKKTEEVLEDLPF